MTENDDLRFEPPESNQVGDTLRVFVKRGPDGAPIVDTKLEDHSGIGKVVGKKRGPMSEAGLSSRTGALQEQVDVLRRHIRTGGVADDLRVEEGYRHLWALADIVHEMALVIEDLQRRQRAADGYPLLKEPEA